MIASGPAATLDVTATADSGAGSLRNQIASAASGDTIAITATGTIALTTGEIVIVGKDLEIAGPGANRLTITTNATTRALRFVNSRSTIPASPVRTARACLATWIPAARSWSITSRAEAAAT